MNLPEYLQETRKAHGAHIQTIEDLNREHHDKVQEAGKVLGARILELQDAFFGEHSEGQEISEARNEDGPSYRR